MWLISYMSQACEKKIERETERDRFYVTKRFLFSSYLLISCYSLKNRLLRRS